MLWLPVFFGAGIGIYFLLKVEPPLWPGVAATVAGAGLSFALRRHPAWCEAALALTVFAAGFALICETARERQAPMLQRHLGPVTVTGRVVDIDLAQKGWRIVVAPDPIPGLDPTDQPHRLRLHIPQTSDELNPGDHVRLKAVLHPVPPQILPGGRDFQRELYFAGIGAVGYTFGGARRITGAEGASEAGGGWREDLRHLRTEMTRRINAVLPGSTGGVASALITGKRGAIAEEVKQSFRDSGLSHLLAIAGLHLGLVGAFVFFAVRGGLALIPWIALRYPIKKIAAAATLLVLTCYLLISGAAIPTERAFVMNGIVFVAIMIDRLRISMRICAIAAAVVLVLDPASLVGVSFQMSFGAVVALIAVYETFGGKLGRILHGRSLLGGIWGYCGAVAVTTLVATLGTYPFSIYHFHHIALYSPLANVIAVPLSALWTLPWGVVTCLLMPFGLERIGAGPDGLGDRGDDLGRAARLVAAGQCVDDPAVAGNRAVGDFARRLVAVLMARAVAKLGFRCNRCRLREHDADPAARHCYCRYRAVCRRASGRRALLCLRRQEREDGALVSRGGDRRDARRLAGSGERGTRRARLRGSVLHLRVARPQGRDHHRRGRAAAQMRRARRDRESGAGRLSLPVDDAGHRPD